jgi:hypothetical protein
MPVLLKVGRLLTVSIDRILGNTRKLKKNSSSKFCCTNNLDSYVIFYPDES